MIDPTPQRTYRAACPNCGAPVEFRSAASALAVCSFCKSTLAREGDELRRIGKSADLFEDHSPLQLGASGTWQGAAFTLVGRLQVRYAGGSWNEWHALFDGVDGDADATRSGWLSEDNGGYVFGFEAAAPADLPAAESLRVGERLALDRDGWTVSAVTTARLAAAEGELPFVPALERAYVVAELRNARGEVASIEYPAQGQNAPAAPQGGGPAMASPKLPPRWTVGRGLQLAELALAGLREDSTRSLASRSTSCPSCGTALEVKLATTQSITCVNCKAVVDVSQGVGGDLAHYAQDTADVEGSKPLLPLGAVGSVALGAGGVMSWQVVGYVERCTLPTYGDDDDEQSFWREYLLYNAKSGFAFVVDAEDGWSWVRPITGAPKVSGIGFGGKSIATWAGESYRELYRYTGQITYVLGEFYWKLERGQRTQNTDYAGPKGKKLNREQTGDAGDAEVTWSAGAALEADLLMKAFKLQDASRGAMLRDVKPVAASRMGLLPALVIFFLLIAVVSSFSRCSRDDCSELRRTYGEASSEYQQCQRNSGSGRSGGGSFGGFGTGGGGHK